MPHASDYAKKFIEKKIYDMGEEVFYNTLRQPILQTMDLFWVDHLEAMDYLRSSVNLRAYGQRDPLVEYKKEGLAFFKEMELSIQAKIAEVITHLDELGVDTKNTTPQFSTNIPSAEVPVQTEKIGRNQKVTIEKDGESKDIKFKKAEGLLKEGWKITDVHKE
tara:strand:- start:115 stop:603 length:489 start_codon:yes stop_codon:yes gene_type:complete